MNVNDLYTRIYNACCSNNGDVALLCNNELQPIGGFDGNKIMPPTYKIGQGKSKKYHIENRWDPEKKALREIVVLDSIQSCANHLETFMLQAVRRNEARMPLIEVHVEEKGKLLRKMRTSFEIAHRIYSSEIFCTVDMASKTPFKDLELTKNLGDPKWSAMDILHLNPLALTFGCWFSQYKKVAGAKPTKIARILTSEIFGYLESQTYMSKSKTCAFDITTKADDKTKKGGRASEQGFGMIPPEVFPQGVSVSRILEKTTISLAAVKSLRVGDPFEDKYDKINFAMRTLAVCQGLYCHALRFYEKEGYFLRSECSLNPTEKPLFYRWIGTNCSNEKPFALPLKWAKQLYEIAIEGMQREDKLFKPDLVLKLLADKDFIKKVKETLKEETKE